MTLGYNPILATDSYKLSHSFAYPDNVKGMSSYIEARTNGKDIIVPFGLQMYLKKYLSQPITLAHIDEAETFAKAHGEPFNRSDWEYIVNTYDGMLPVDIFAIPEGTPIRSGNAIVVIECTDPKVFWLSSYLETAIQRAVWYPTTIASMDYAIKKEIAHFYRISGADMGLLPFALHDFGARGVSSAETAEIGGAAHLVNFMGSDTIEGIRAANYYYNENMAAFSVPATEHSIECSFGSSNEEEEQYLSHVLDTLAKPGGIVSIVIDGYDVFRAAQTLCTKFKDKIIASGAKVVFRPDSGDMMEVVPRILEMQEKAFGFDYVSAPGGTKYKKIKYVGIIQGDGVDHMSIKSLLGKILVLGYSADCVIFGSGGALLQKVNRDTFKFAQKASAVLIDGKWVGISKKPSSGGEWKVSKAGQLSLFKSKLTGEHVTLDINKPISDEFENEMILVYSYGQVVNTSTLAQVRERAKI